MDATVLNIFIASGATVATWLAAFFVNRKQSKHLMHMDMGSLVDRVAVENKRLTDENTRLRMHNEQLMAEQFALLQKLLKNGHS